MNPTGNQKSFGKSLGLLIGNLLMRLKINITVQYDTNSVLGGFKDYIITKALFKVSLLILPLFLKTST